MNGTSDLMPKSCNELDRRLVEPVPKLATRPFPLERMSKALVVVRLTVQDMLNHLIATIPVPAQQVSFAESFQQRLCLIQPRRIDRCE